MTTAAEMLGDLLERMDRDASNDDDAFAAGDIDSIPADTLAKATHERDGVAVIELVDGTRYRIAIEALPARRAFVRVDTGDVIEAIVGEPIAAELVLDAAMLVELEGDRYALSMSMSDGDLYARRIVS